MSIIQDALRKAGRDKGLKIQVPTERRKSKVNWGPLFILLILFVITGPLVLPLFSTPFKSSIGQDTRILQASNEPVNTPAQTSNRSAQFGMESLPVAAINSMGPANLSLSGIVYSPEGSYCILNGQILKQGESMQGIRLEKVSEDHVTLNVNGETLVVSSR